MKYPYTKNRELSWLSFNERVLDKVFDTTTPLMERLKFFAIFISNLDEFFMIRVGSLENISDINSDAKDSKTDLPIKSILNQVMDYVQILMKKKDKAYDLILNDLKNEEIEFLKFKDLDSTKKKELKKQLKNEIIPLLSPQILDFNHPFPHIENKMLYLIATLKHKDNEVLGLVSIPKSLGSYIKIDSKKFILLEQLLFDNANSIFSNYKIIHKNIISITRNADISFDDLEFDEQNDFKDIMKGLIKKRGRLHPVRIECKNSLNEFEEKILLEKLHLDKNHEFLEKSPIKYDFIYDFISEFSNNTKFFYPKISQRTNQYINTSEKIIPQILKHDALLFYPYESMTPFLQLIKEAAYDKYVVSIKITIYRLSKNSKLVDYLCQAAENGKEVLALIELRARFDEQNNIDFSEKLEASGVHIMYGFEHFKVHSKICLITRRINEHLEYITQIGTGNYNEKTVNIYTDYSYITANNEIGLDAQNFFNNMLLGNVNGSYNKILVSPTSLKNNIQSLIDEQILLKENGYIFLKINSITDIDIINKLVEASQMGVKIDIIVRGICCILPNVLGYTENITIKSIVGRFLEHSRIYLFGKNNPKIYISSADMMTRNTIRRVEVAAPILNEGIKKRILSDITILLNDTYNSKYLNSSGKYEIKTDMPFLDSMTKFLEQDQKTIKRISNKKIITNYLDAKKIKYECNVTFSDEIKISRKFNFYLPAKNTYLLVINNKASINYSMIEKWYLISKLLNSNNKSLILIFTNKINNEAAESLNRIKIKYTYINSLEI